MEAVGPVIEYAKDSGAKEFLFVSSCGIYKSSQEPPHVEARPQRQPTALEPACPAPPPAPFGATRLTRTAWRGAAGRRNQRG